MAVAEDLEIIIGIAIQAETEIKGRFRFIRLKTTGEGKEQLVAGFAQRREPRFCLTNSAEFCDDGIAQCCQIGKLFINIIPLEHVCRISG